jgi:hypothetical protein
VTDWPGTYYLTDERPVATPDGAPAGQQLPNTSKFKGNLTGRYNLSWLSEWHPFLQSSLVDQSAFWADLRSTGGVSQCLQAALDRGEILAEILSRAARRA